MNRKSVERLQYAAECFRRNRLAEAESTCRRLLGPWPEAVDVLHLLALVRRKSGDPDEAESLLRRCLALEPRRAEMHANLGNLLAAAGRVDESRQAYEHALAVDPGFRSARLGLARVLNRLGHFDTAARHVQELIDGNPGDSAAWAALGTAFGGRGRTDEAESAWRRAISIDPDYGAAHHGLAALLSDLGRSEEALSEVERSAAAGIRGPEIDFVRASTLMSLNRFDDAERVLTDSIQAYPRPAATQGLLARIRFMRDAENFADGLASAVRKYPEDVQLILEYCRVLRGAGSLRDARAALGEALRTNPSQPDLSVELAAVRQEEGDFDGALSQARSALTLAPGNVGAQEALIDALLSLGRARDAMPAIENLRRRAPANQWYIAMEATAARLLGDPRYAKYYDYENLVRVFELEPPEGWSSIGEFHRDLIPLLMDRHRFQAEPLDQSLRSGTQTPRNLAGDPDPRMQSFLRALEKPINEYRDSVGFAPDHPFRSRNKGATKIRGCWSVLLNQGGHHVNHVHTKGWISSAYYVAVPADVPEQDHPGWLKFGEPRFPVPNAFAEKRVQPRAGRLVLFPSYMWHGTTAFHAPEQRLTIAFDAVPQGDS